MQIKRINIIFIDWVGFVCVNPNEITVKYSQELRYFMFFSNSFHARDNWEKKMDQEGSFNTNSRVVGMA
jgi:hypothetical protein